MYPIIQTENMIKTRASKLSRQ